VIVDLERFVAEGRAHWSRLEAVLDDLAKSPDRRLNLAQVRELHYLYQRASSDLAKIATFSSERETRRYLESLVARAYGEIHETRKKAGRLAPLRWFTRTFPRTFRRHLPAFAVSVAITLLGAGFGGLAMTFDPEAKDVVMPFAHLQTDPSERVAREEGAKADRLEGRKATFSFQLMTHNTQVSIFAMALGITWGLGTGILLFYNGVVLGAVAVDYLAAGEGPFLFGWLLPHGAVEIPAILIAGQAGLVLAGALIGWGDPRPLRSRLRRVSAPVVTLVAGVGILLVWAGVVEAFLSQYHEPTLPYALKITLGAVELGLLVFFLGACGRREDPNVAG
jgi:uncharacterized membrane protein SpoIIM required for sporulation